MKTVIEINALECVGCLRCALACSDLYDKAYNPAAARIRVEAGELKMEISFTEDCEQCGLCADHCLYGALQKMEREANS